MNVQNIPREAVIKSCFVPKRGMFLFFDYSQIEYRLLAYYLHKMGYPSMSEVFKDDRDLHTETAKAIYQTEAPTPNQRHAGKTLNFSMIYGGGTKTVMRQLHVTRPEATRLLNAFHKQWPGIGRPTWVGGVPSVDPNTLVGALQQRFANRGYVKTLWGRHLHPTSEHKILNAVIQGSAADLMRQSLVKVDDYVKYLDGSIVNVIHDELMLDVNPQAFCNGDVKIITDLMRDSNIESIIPIDIGITYTTIDWGHKLEFSYNNSPFIS